MSIGNIQQKSQSEYDLIINEYKNRYHIGVSKVNNNNLIPNKLRSQLTGSIFSSDKYLILKNEILSKSSTIHINNGLIISKERQQMDFLNISYNNIDNSINTILSSPVNMKRNMKFNNKTQNFYLKMEDYQDKYYKRNYFKIKSKANEYIRFVNNESNLN